MTARPIVRRVKDLSSKAAAAQGELFTAWRYHAIFTDSPFETIRAEEQHRGHVQAGQVFADWTDGPLAHLPSGSFPANATWLALAVISCSLLRRRRQPWPASPAPKPAAPPCAPALSVPPPASPATAAAILLCTCPEGWHREHEWMNLFEAAWGPPAAAA
jgi:hypothetical protein